MPFVLQWDPFVNTSYHPRKVAQPRILFEKGQSTTLSVTDVFLTVET